MSIDISSAVPGFDLEDQLGQRWGPVSGEATVIAFTSRFCPEATACEERLAALAADYAPRGIRVLLVAVDEDPGPPAGPLPLLLDPLQDTARAFGATVTPEVFLADGDGKLRYRGSDELLREAIELTLAAAPPGVDAITLAVGCPIAWREA